MDLRRVGATGLAGAAAMAVTTSLDMLVRRRPASELPAQVLGRVPGLEGVARRHVTAISWLAPIPSALAVAAARPRLPFAAFAALVWAPDLVLAPDPPWRWPKAEIALSAVHHAAFALAAEAAYRRSGSRCSS